ncbi:Probable beta-D-xylosidase 6 (AtBXL6), partial [Durusdinium trenchii]
MRGSRAGVAAAVVVVAVVASVVVVAARGAAAVATSPVDRAGGTRRGEVQVSETALEVSRRYSNACLERKSSQAPPFAFCDESKSLEERAAALVNALTLEDKAGLLGNTAEAARSAGLPAYQWWGEALHGIGLSPAVRFDTLTKHVRVTSFPQVIVTAASWNRTLFRDIASAISTEGRAMNNAGLAGLTFWAPNINIFRDPRWGRGQETPGEDPKLNGDYAAAFVSAFQSSDVDPKRLKASACCKHFAAYNLEQWHGHNRMSFDAQVSDRDMHETYLPAFESCVRRGKVSSLMCSYNAINGVPSCANKALLKHTARESWGFEGYVTGDCAAVANLDTKYHFRNHSRAELVGDALDATVDVACDAFLQKETVAAVASGKVDENLVDAALMNLFKVQLRLGMFDPADAQPFRKIGLDAIDTDAHRALALEAARQGIVLVKNAGDHVLPIVRARHVPPLGLIGPHANSTWDLLGNYFGLPRHIISLRMGVEHLYKHVRVAKGCKLLCKLGSTEAMMQDAEALARDAWRTIVAVGLNQANEREGHDRETLRLPGRQHELVRRVAAAAKAAGRPPIVVVLIAGGAVDLSAELANDHVGAILWAGYPGQAGGMAIAETIFGLNNPSGRLTQTFYHDAFVQNVSMVDMAMHPDPARGFPGRTYRFFTGEPVLAFGHGLSYAKFAYEVDAVVGRRVTVRVRNIHPTRTGAHVLLAFLRPPPLARGHLERKLHHYHRTQVLQPGTVETVEIDIDSDTDYTVFASSEHSEPTWVGGGWTLELMHPEEGMISLEFCARFVEALVHELDLSMQHVDLSFHVIHCLFHHPLFVLEKCDALSLFEDLGLAALQGKLELEFALRFK